MPYFDLKPHLYAANIILLFFLVVSPLWADGQPTQTKHQGCNVILITTNVLRYNHLAPYGYERNTMPTINALAKESYIFDHAFAQAGYTLPNMMSILTSLYPVSHGVLDAFKDTLPARIHTLAEILKIHGYKTAWFADLNEPHLFPSVGFGHGYDVKTKLFNDLRSANSVANWVRHNKRERFFITINSRHTHSPYFPLPKYGAKFSAGQKGDLPENTEVYLKTVYYDIVDQMERPDGVLHTVYDEKTKALIKKMAPEGASGQRFWIKTFDRVRLLTPQNKQYQLSNIRMKAYTKRVQTDNPQNLAYIRAMYDGCILGIDQEIIKPLIKTLKKNKIYDKTLIVFTADHGESLGEHGLVGHGLVYWDQLVHVPLIVKLPGETRSARINTLVQSIDIMPTILDYLKIEIPYHAQGRSLLPLMWTDSTASRQDYVFGANRISAYLRNHMWKLIAPRDLQKNKANMRLALYNIKDDPEEHTNLAEKHPDLAAKLFKRLTNHLEALPKYSEGDDNFPADMDEQTRERIKKTGYW